MIPEIEDARKKLIAKVKKHYSDDLERLELYQRATNYLTAAQLYLQENVLLQNTLKPEQIKSRLTGHWGTCPGINLIYAHLNRLILFYECNMLLVTGSAHGAAAILANLYLEETLLDFYPSLTLDKEGMEVLIKNFAWPGGFPNYLYPGIPGVLYEGELGSALATAYGAVMDHPDLIAACIVGDGEAETGPTATAWHSHKFLDPAESGAVLPIVQINGYKASSPSIYGTMSETELENLFHGYGFHPIFVEEPDLNAGLFAAMDWSYREIQLIQKAAREGDRIEKPRWPVILLRIPKGWMGIKKVNGTLIEGTVNSHYVPAKDLKTNKANLRLVEEWLKSYKPEELFDSYGVPSQEVLSFCPRGSKRLGRNPEILGGSNRRALRLPNNINHYEIVLGKNSSDKSSRGKKKMSSLHALNAYITSIIKDNPSRFRIFSPDELESSQINLFEVTHRNYQWPFKTTESHIGPEDGRVLEMLSETTCQEWMQGYALTGRYGLFLSYEAFLGMISSRMNAFAKFVKISKKFFWRNPIPSLNYLTTSTHWKQGHNGFIYQNPGYLNSLLNKTSDLVRIYFPPDANSLLAIMDQCLPSKNIINLMIVNNGDLPLWLTLEEAIQHCKMGASIWKWASTDEGVDPDLVLVGIGDVMMREVLAAAKIILQEIPQLRIRVVNVADLSVLEKENGMDRGLFDTLFDREKPVICNFHAYPSALRQLLSERGDSSRFLIHGFADEGISSTPFDMLMRNGASRYQLLIEAIRVASIRNPHVAASAYEKISYYKSLLHSCHQYILENGEDPEEIVGWEWS